MFERILVPLDGSALAEIALPYAEELAGKMGSQITLMHVRESTEHSDRHVHQFYIQKIAEATKQAAGKYRTKLGAPAIQVTSAILDGNPAEKIVEYADKEDIGLIVMATHGRTGITRWALGSVADKVMRAAKRPVVLIRAKDARPDVRETGILGKALVPLDGSEEGESAIPFIGELASNFKAEIVLLQVLAAGHQFITADGYNYFFYPEEEIESAKAFAKDYLDKVGTRLKQKGVTVNTEVRTGDAAEEILKLADAIHADVVAMSTHGRSGVGRWVFGSVAERVLQGGSTPLLLVRASAGD